MIKEVIMPKIGYTMEEGLIVKWLKQVGDPVQAGEPLVEISSDKANMEIEAPDGGFLLKILAEEGEYVPVLQALGLIGEADERLPDEISPEGDAAQQAAAEGAAEDALAEAADGTAEPPKVSEDGAAAAGLPSADYTANRLSPRARRIAREKGLSEERLALVTGTGYRGMVVERDLQDAMRERGGGPEHAVEGAKYVVPSAIRQISAQRLTQSVREAPQYFVGAEVLAEGLLRVKSAFEALTGEKMSVSALLVKCVARALELHKDRANVSWIEGKIMVHPEIRIGVAVASDRGLSIAVLDGAERMGLAQINQKLGELSDKAREGRLSLAEASGSTFTISNLGMYGADNFRAILNPPESGILAVGRIRKKAVVLEDDRIEARPVMQINLTADHRVLDGADAAQLLAAIKQYIEHPELMI